MGRGRASLLADFGTYHSKPPSTQKWRDNGGGAGGAAGAAAGPMPSVHGIVGRVMPRDGTRDHNGAEKQLAITALEESRTNLDAEFEAKDTAGARSKAISRGRWSHFHAPLFVSYGESLMRY